MTFAQVTQALPADLAGALLVGRVWRGGAINGPCVVVVRNGEVFDITAQAPTVSELFERSDLAAFVRGAQGESLGPVQRLLDAALAAQPD
eukprot:gene31123-31718_t